MDIFNFVYNLLHRLKILSKKKLVSSVIVYNSTSIGWTPFMNRTVIMLFSLFLFLNTPSCLLANEIETVISADRIFVEPDNILRAKGNVKVRRGDVLIEAEEMIVDEKSNRIDFKDITNFFDGKAIKIEAQEAILSDDLSEGIISAVNILIDDTIKIRAGKVSFKDNAMSRYSSIVGVEVAGKTIETV